jgi:RNA polymerase sigma factor (sigma-70 family)
VTPTEKSPTAHREAGRAWESPSPEEYARYRPLLFRALVSLARRDYDIPADEGLELIHEFFLDAWPGLQQRYDPAKGAFSTYIFGAFLRFARPRIVSARSWHERFVGWDPIALDTLQAQSDQAETELDTQAVGHALSSLSQADRTLLEQWLARGTSERRVARAMGLSRYKTRQGLVAALTRLAIAMGQQVGASGSDWRIASALWAEGRSVADTAATLGVTTTQVRHARRRVFDFLANALVTQDERSRVSEGSDVS